MIVQCPQCRARFRVADEKVPEKGVKVRCTKCANVFKVTRADAVEAAPKAAAAADFGLAAAPPPPGRRSSAYDLGGAEPGLDVPLRAAGPRVAPNLPQAVSLVYGAGSPGRAAAFDDGPGAPSADPEPAPAPEPASTYSSDPFADLDFGPGSAAPPPAPVAPASVDPFADMDFGAAAPPPPAFVPPAPLRPAAGRAQAPGADPFADSFDAPPAPPPRAMPTPRPRLTPTPRPAPRSALAGDDDPFAVPAPADDGDPFAGVEHSLGPKGLAPAPDAASVESPSDFADPVPAAGGPRITRTGGTVIEFTETTGGPKLDLDFAGAGLADPGAREGQAGLGRISLFQQRPEPAKPRPVDPSEATRMRLRREIAAAVFNVFSALVVGLTGLVTIAAVRAPRPLTLDDAGFNIVWLAIGATDDRPADLLRPVDVHTGTYVTRGGRELFFVTGLAENAASASRDAVHVSVEVRQGDQVLGHAESLAALGAGPEQLFGLESGRNDELQRHLAEGAPPLRLPPRSRAPFIAVFGLGAKDVEGAEVHLTVDDGIPPPLKPLFPPPAAKDGRAPADGLDAGVPEDFVGPPAAVAEATDGGPPVSAEVRPP